MQSINYSVQPPAAAIQAALGVRSSGSAAAVCGGRVIRPRQPPMHSTDNDTKNGFLGNYCSSIEYK